MQPAKPLMKPVERHIEFQGCTKLLRQISAEDRESFERFYDTTCGLIYGLLLRILSDSRAAEEVMVSVYLKFWQESFRSNAAGEPFLILFINLAHQSGIERSYLDRKIEETVTSNGNVHSQPALAAAVHDSNSKILKQLQSHVRSVLKSIPAEQLEILELAYSSGMKVNEIAIYLERFLKMVRENLNLGMTNLREQL